MNKVELNRLIIAACLAAAVSIIALLVSPWFYRVEIGANPVYLLGGYFAILVQWLVVMGFLVLIRTLISCVIAGGILSGWPFMFLNFVIVDRARFNLLNSQSLLDLVIFVGFGMLGGALFWFIAFAKRNK